MREAEKYWCEVHCRRWKDCRLVAGHGLTCNEREKALYGKIVTRVVKDNHVKEQGEEL